MLTVADVMTRRVVAVAGEAPVTRALDAMRARGISSVLVRASGSAGHGIVTMRDVISRVVREDRDPGTVRARDIATWNLATADLSWTLQTAAEQMAGEGVRHLLVTAGSDLLGIVSDSDVFAALVPRQEWAHARVVRKERAWRRAAESSAARRVGDVMSAPVLSIGADAPVPDVVQKMVASGVTSLLISTSEGPVTGIVTKRDVVTRVLAPGRDARRVAAGAIMSAPVRTIGAEATIGECSARMTAEGVRRFPVVRREELIGLISESDILAAVAAGRWWSQRAPRWPTTYIVADVMRPASGAYVRGLDAVPPELSVWECAARLARSPLNELPVVQEGRLIGTVRSVDLWPAIEERGGAC